MQVVHQFLSLVSLVHQIYLHHPQSLLRLYDFLLIGSVSNFELFSASLRLVGGTGR